MELTKKVDRYLEQINAVSKTKKAYKDDIMEFLEFLYKNNKSIETPNIFEYYANYLREIKHRTESTVRRKKTAITRFYLFCFPSDEFNHFCNCIVYYDRNKKLIIKDYSQLKILINKTPKVN